MGIYLCLAIFTAAEDTHPSCIANRVNEFQDMFLSRIKSSWIFLLNRLLYNPSNFYLLHIFWYLRWLIRKVCVSLNSKEDNPQDLFRRARVAADNFSIIHITCRNRVSGWERIATWVDAVRVVISTVLSLSCVLFTVDLCRLGITRFCRASYHNNSKALSLYLPPPFSFSLSLPLWSSDAALKVSGYAGNRTPRNDDLEYSPARAPACTLRNGSLNQECVGLRYGVPLSLRIARISSMT